GSQRQCSANLSLVVPMSGAYHHTPHQCGHYISTGWPSNNLPVRIQMPHQSRPVLN
ncbi:hypothetical protein A2U01_0101278, partial [Trifolium medium]|nr:hypothetical protein [Trifolium medium]